MWFLNSAIHRKACSPVKIPCRPPAHLSRYMDRRVNASREKINTADKPTYLQSSVHLLFLAELSAFSHLYHSQRLKLLLLLSRHLVLNHTGHSMFDTGGQLHKLIPGLLSYSCLSWWKKGVLLNSNEHFYKSSSQATTHVYFIIITGIQYPL